MIYMVYDVLRLMRHGCRRWWRKFAVKGCGAARDRWRRRTCAMTAGNILLHEAAAARLESSGAAGSDMAAMQRKLRAALLKRRGHACRGLRL